MSVITKKTEKVSEVVGELLDGFTFEQFLTAFQAGFPKDWSKVVRSSRSTSERLSQGSRIRCQNRPSTCVTLSTSI